MKLDFYAAAMAQLREPAANRATEVGNGVLAHAFMLLGPGAFNGLVEGVLSSLREGFPGEDDAWIGETACQEFHKAFRQRDVCERFDGHACLDVRKQGAKPRTGEVSANGTVDLLAWQALRAQHGFWPIMKKLAAADGRSRRGEPTDLADMLEEI